MKTVLLVAVLLIATHSMIQELTADNFEVTLQREPNLVVLFYTPSQGSCKQFLTQYEVIDGIPNRKKYTLAKVNTQKEEGLAKLCGVTSVPTISIYHKQRVIQSLEMGKSGTLHQFLNRLLIARITHISESELAAKIGKESFVLFSSNNQEASQIMEVINALDPSRKYYKLEGDYHIRIYDRRKTEFKEFEGQIASVATLMEWIEDHLIPEIIPLVGKKNIDRIYNDPLRRPALLLIQENDFTRSAKAQFEKYCDQKYGNVVCFILKPHDEEYQKTLSYLEADDKQRGRTIVAYVRDNMDQIFFYDMPQFQIETFSQLVTRAENGKQMVSLQKTKRMRSTLQFRNVLELLDAQFEKTIAETKLLLIFFTGRGCQACIDMIEQIEKLAEDLRVKEPEIVISFVDLDVQTRIRAIAKVPMATFRVYIEGQIINYYGDKNAAGLQVFLLDLLHFQLETVNLEEELPLRVPIVHVNQEAKGIRFLPYVFKESKVLHYPTNGDPFIEYRTEGAVETFRGQMNIETALQWLVYQSTPVLSDFLKVESSLRLSRAINMNLPLLAYVNRDGNATPLKELEDYCRDLRNISCGYASKGPQEFNRFEVYLGETEKHKSRLVYIKFKENKKFIYGGKITNASIKKFVQEVEIGKQKPHKHNSVSNAEIESDEL